MIIKDSDASKRLNSADNLINKLKSGSLNSARGSAMRLFGIGKRKDIQDPVQETVISFNPFEIPTAATPKSLLATVEPSDKTNVDSILENADSQVKLGLAHDNALTLLNRSVDMLTTKLDDIKSDKLPQVISAASKVVESIRRVRSEAPKNNKYRDVHLHFYTPNKRKLTDYEVIDVA